MAWDKQTWVPNVALIVYIAPVRLEHTVRQECSTNRIISDTSHVHRHWQKPDTEALRITDPKFQISAEDIIDAISR
jgi:hypothetical protein